jgi:hypothetical protein
LIRRYVPRIARTAFRLMMRGTPRTHRFGAAVVLARGFAPVARRAGLFRRLRRWPLNSEHEMTLHVLLGELSDGGIGFDPPVRQAGLERLDDAVASGRGVLLISPHTLLTRLAVRRLHACGYPVTAVTADAAPPRSGVPAIHRSPFFLLAARAELARGRIVFAMVDRSRPQPGITVPAETAMGTVHVADPLIRLALRCGSRVAFITSRFHAGVIQSEIALPGSGAGGDVEAVRAQFIRFVQEFVARPVDRIQSHQASPMYASEPPSAELAQVP